MSRERFSFPILVGIFVYFSALVMCTAIFWETGIWFQSGTLSNLGTMFAGILVASIIAVVGLLFYLRTKNPTHLA